MKVTRKSYQEKYSERSELICAKHSADRADDMPSYFEAKARIEELDKEFFDKLPTVKVSFSIGSRSYYQEVVKIGKSYFKYGESLTAGRGYYGVTEIPEITEKMTHEMISDSYYY